MRITDLLKPSGVKLGGVATSKSDAIDQLIDLMVGQGNVTDRAAYRKAVDAREAIDTTAVGEGIAIPHAKTSAVSAPGLVAMTVPGGVDYDAPDGRPADLLFLIAAPDTEANVHLEVLARLSALLMDADFCTKLRAAQTPEEFCSVVDAAETERVAKEEAVAAQSAARDAEGYDVVAITACPTGIAHTYMAAEALEKTAAEKGVKIKVETQGSAGAKNKITAADLKDVKGVIIAADKNVELDRFVGLPVYTCAVSKGYEEPEKLIDIALAGSAPVWQGVTSSGAATAAVAEGAVEPEKESVWRQIYKHLMNGVSHMLPFVIGGGILTAIAFLVDQPGVGTSDYGSSIPAAAFFKTIGNEAFGLMLPILAAYIAQSIADRPGLAPGFVGGLFAKEGYNITYLATLDDSGLVSGGFIAALFAGFVAGYLTLAIEKLCDRMPSSLEGIKPMLIYPVFGILGTGAVMFVVNPLFAWINTALSTWLTNLGTGNIVLLGMLLGAMMSTDMGGPFNKAAYAFGTAMIDPSSGFGETGEIIMASVMIGGMIPPLVIALSTTFFKNRWTKADRDAGAVNYIMGLSFITEGAIPFAASDPGHVLPSCIIGAGLGGALSALWGCTSPAPHGGIWIIGVIGNWPMYLLALVIGSVVGCLILSLTKKPLPPEESGLAKAEAKAEK